MKNALTLAAIVGLIATPLFAGPNGAVTGSYVEARTAEVFTGGCTMGSEAETVGRNAVLAWRIDRGSFGGVALDGLAVVAAVSGDRNLGIREIGGVSPNAVRALIVVDDRASAPQRDALVALARELSRGLIGESAEVRAAPVSFTSDARTIRVAAAEAQLAVTKQVIHDPSCGAMQWFKPLSTVDRAAIGMTTAHAFSGEALGTKWSDPNKKSAFFGTFTY